MAEVKPPVPDPTILTTEQLFRAIETLEKLFDAKLNGLKDLHEEKFSSVSKQFIERDTARVSAALSAKEALAELRLSFSALIQKIETSTDKRFDQQKDALDTQTKTMDGKLELIRDRIGAGERQSNVSEGQKKGAGDSWTAIGTIAAILISASAVVVALITRH